MALTTRLNEMRVRDNVTFALEPPLSVNNYVLAANTAVNINISDLVDSAGITPKAMIFSCTGNFYVLWNGTGATIPSASVINGTGAEINPAIRRVGANITQFSIISPSACVLQLALYSQVN
jgi:hypothetical protein